MSVCSCGVLGDNIQQLFRVQSPDRSICLRVSGAVAPSALPHAFSVAGSPDLGCGLGRVAHGSKQTWCQSSSATFSLDLWIKTTLTHWRSTRCTKHGSISSSYGARITAWGTFLQSSSEIVFPIFDARPVYTKFRTRPLLMQVLGRLLMLLGLLFCSLGWGWLLGVGLAIKTI